MFTQKEQSCENNNNNNNNNNSNNNNKNKYDINPIQTDKS